MLRRESNPDRWVEKSSVSPLGHLATHPKRSKTFYINKLFKNYQWQMTPIGFYCCTSSCKKFQIMKHYMIVHKDSKKKLPTIFFWNKSNFRRKLNAEAEIHTVSTKYSLQSIYFLFFEKNISKYIFLKKNVNIFKKMDLLIVGFRWYQTRQTSWNIQIFICKTTVAFLQNKNPY